ncbi:MAG: hypothetical protein ACRDKI_04545 [Solirubrobacterales bacterium]
MATKKTLLAMAAAVVAVLCVTWVASAANTNGQSAKKRSSHVRISAFKKPFHPTPAQRRERAKLARVINRAPRKAIAASASASEARPARVDGTDRDVWISPAGNGGVCTFVPDALDGYAMSCATEEDIRSGAAVTLLGGGADEALQGAAIVAVVVPDGADAPTLKAPDGDLSAVSITANTAAELVPLGSTVYSGDTIVRVPALTTPKCPPQVAGQPTRCTL